MTDAKVTWQAGLTFSGSAGSGFSVPLGTDDGFRPLELMAVSLAGCTAMDVISILQKKRQDVTAFEVGVHADQAAEHPKVFSAARITFRVTGHGVDEAAVVRAIELSATKYCPAQAMLEKSVPIALHYEIFEDLGEGKVEKVREGQWRKTADGIR
jgi:putative redox protein